MYHKKSNAFLVCMFILQTFLQSRNWFSVQCAYLVKQSSLKSPSLWVTLYILLQNILRDPENMIHANLFSTYMRPLKNSRPQLKGLVKFNKIYTNLLLKDFFFLLKCLINSNSRFDLFVIMHFVTKIFDACYRRSQKTWDLPISLLHICDP